MTLARSRRSARRSRTWRRSAASARHRGDDEADNEDDNIMGKVAKTDNYDGLLQIELAKYDKAREAIATNVSSQADILSWLRATHARFTQMYDVDAWRAATDAHASSVRAAVAHYRELSSGLEQGLTFYSGFAEAVNRLAGECEGFVENRRREKAQPRGGRQEAEQAAVAHHQGRTPRTNAAVTSCCERAGWPRRRRPAAAAQIRNRSCRRPSRPAPPPPPSGLHRRTVLLAAATPVRLPSALQYPRTEGTSSATGVPLLPPPATIRSRQSQTSIRWLP